MGLHGMTVPLPGTLADQGPLLRELVELGRRAFDLAEVPHRDPFDVVRFVARHG